MPRYKCGRCGHELISEDVPSSCECCDAQDIFIEYIEYLVYKSLLDEKLSVRTKIVTELENEKSILDKKVSDLDSKNQDFRTQKTDLESKLQVVKKYKNILLALASLAIVGLGILCFNQYQKANNLEEKNSSATNKIGEQSEKIKSQSKKIENLNNQVLMDNIASAGQDGKLKELKGKVKDYENLLSNYPFALSTGQEVIYQGNLVSASKSQQTYQIWVQTGSYFDISLYGLTADADLEIVDKNEQTLENSKKTNAGTTNELLNNFYLSPGSYGIKVKLYSGSSTSYSLKVYRRPNS